MSVSPKAPKAIYRVSQNPIKIPMTFFNRNRRTKILEICMEPQRAPAAKAILRGGRGNKVEVSFTLISNYITKSR